MLEWVKATALGRAMQEWSEVWQPAYDDIDKWKVISDIGKFSDKTINEWKEAWATIPKPAQKEIYKLFLKLQKVITSDVLVKMVELYLNSIVRK